MKRDNSNSCFQFSCLLKFFAQFSTSIPSNNPIYFFSI